MIKLAYEYLGQTCSNCDIGTYSGLCADGAMEVVTVSDQVKLRLQKRLISWATKAGK